MSEGTDVDTISDDAPEVTLGVDTHLDQHAAAALDAVGRLLGTISVPATTAGYEQLLAWASGFGVVTRAGVEGTGCYGAGVARFLQLLDSIPSASSLRVQLHSRSSAAAARRCDLQR